MHDQVCSVMKSMTFGLVLLLYSVYCNGQLSFTGPPGKVCPGDLIQFTCQRSIVGTELVTWEVSNLDSSTNILDRSFVVEAQDGGISIPLMFRDDPGFGFMIIWNVMSGDLSTVLTVNASIDLDGATVKCIITENEVLSISVRRPPIISVLEAVNLPDNSDFAGTMLSWTSTPSAENYTVTISPSPPKMNGSVTTVDTNLMVTLLYNEMYTISVFGINCDMEGNVTSIDYKIVQCAEPMEPANGQLGPVNGRGEGAVVTFWCNTGFLPREDMNTTCISNGTWYPVDPGQFVCSIVTCLPLQPPVNGSSNSSVDSTPLGTTVTFQCDDGLFPTDVRTATCRDMSGRGEWEPNPAQLVCCECSCTDQGTIDTSAASAGVDVAISVVVTFIVSVLIGLTGGVLGTYLFMRDKVCKQNGPPSTASTNPPPPQEQQPPPGPVYEEVSTPKDIELETNLAYGPVRQ